MRELVISSQKFPKDKINYGLDYFLTQGISLSAYQAYGNELGLQLNVSASPSSYAGDFLEKTPEPFYSEPLPYKSNNEDFLKDLKKELDAFEINLIAHLIEGEEITIIIENNHYSTHVQAIGRTFRVLSKFTPTKIKTFKVVISELGIPITEVSLNRNKLAEIIDAPNSEYLTKKISGIISSPKKIAGATFYREEKKAAKLFNLPLL